jgi:hypothetical protein
MKFTSIPFFIIVLFLCLYDIDELSKTDANLISENIVDEYVPFDSLLNFLIKYGTYTRWVKVDLIRDEHNNDNLSNYFRFFVENFEINYRAEKFQDSCEVKLVVNGKDIQYVINAENDVIPIPDDLQVLEDRVQVSRFNGRAIDWVLIPCKSIDAFGKYSYLCYGLLLNVNHDSGSAYLIHSYVNIPRYFYWSYNWESEGIDYLDIEIEDFSLNDRDSVTRYLIKPTCINLNLSKFNPYTNSTGHDKLMIVESYDFYNNDSVKIISKNW